VHDFHYRLPARMGGQRPGAHAGSSRGPGMEFISHQSLYNQPDPRRLDVRASLREPRGDWLVRVSRQRVSVPVYVVADVSPSMAFGAKHSKLQVLADFAEAAGHSAFRAGDPAGLIAFDYSEREDLFRPAALSRGAGQQLAAPLRLAPVSRAMPAKANLAAGLLQAAQRLAGRQALVFLASDFHWPLAPLDDVLGLLARACVVPVVIWDPAELEPPAEDGLVVLRDAENASRRTLWLRPRLRQQWRAAVAARRDALKAFFEQRGLRPFYVEGAFNAEAMSEYFLEANL